MRTDCSQSLRLGSRANVSIMVPKHYCIVAINVVIDRKSSKKYSRAVLAVGPEGRATIFLPLPSISFRSRGNEHAVLLLRHVQRACAASRAAGLAVGLLCVRKCSSGAGARAL